MLVSTASWRRPRLCWAAPRAELVTCWLETDLHSGCNVLTQAILTGNTELQEEHSLLSVAQVGLR